MPTTIQSFQRDARRLLRHPLMREVTNGGVYMSEVTRVFAQRFVFVGNHPGFALAYLHRLVRQALRLVETGRRPWALYRRYLDYSIRSLILMRGFFCGLERPMLADTFCTICQSDADGPWWYSMRCCHHFHVECLFEHLAYDSRCPLCRAEI